MSNSLEPWFAVAVPHEDIREGRLDESVFAANLWAVVQGSAPEVYLDPEEFFRKTYLTSGLKYTLARMAKALAGGEAGDRILSLQTSFGGGKTHTLVALWHLAKHAERLRTSPAAGELRAALGNGFPNKVLNVAVFTNATCDPTQGRHTPEGVHTRTVWGELAVQLGGRELYQRVRPNDETQRVPQGLFVDVLREAAPCLILLDEIADYCTGAGAVPVGDRTLADQTISFMQQLEEAVQQVPGSAVVATLPASRYEVGQGEAAHETFIALEKRFRRLAADQKPVEGSEIYEVVRARLFDRVARADSSHAPRDVAAAFMDMYKSHAGEVPPEATRQAYREQMERAYPFHPLLIDALHTRWASHPDFQLTRGVLRLLASIVGDLWQRRDTNTQSQPLIQPAHVRWSIDALQGALTGYWGAAYQAVTAADVTGEKANARLLDEERGGDYEREKIGQGVAASILLGSFGGEGARSGFSSKDLRLACSRPGLNWNYTDGALLELENRSFYLHTAQAGSAGKRYWYGTKPTLNHLVVRYRQQIERETFNEEIVEALRQKTEAGSLGQATWRVVVDPGVDLPEQRSLTLVVLSPSLAWNDDKNSREQVVDYVRTLSARCGSKERLYRNTLVFLAPTARGLSKLRRGYRDLAALQGVEGDYRSQLDDEQLEDLRGRLAEARRVVSESLGSTYSIALRVDVQEVVTFELADPRREFREHLQILWSELMEEAEWILPKIGRVTLRESGLVPESGALAVRDAIDAFLRYTDKPMIASKAAVTRGLEDACREGQIGIGRGPSKDSLHVKLCKDSVSLEPNEEGVWILPPFEPQAELDEDADDKEPTGNATTEGEKHDIDVPVHRGEPVRGVRIRGSVPIENWGELFRCFVGPANSLKLSRVKLGVDFELDAADGQLRENDQALKNMKEAARQLGLTFEQQQPEEDET